MTEHAEIIDPESGLFTEPFLDASLPVRVATARRAMKQLGLVTVQVGSGDDGSGAPVATVGEVIRDTLRDSDTAVRLGGGRYALLLEFTPVEGCEIISHRLLDSLAAACPGTAVCAGVASYPVHALSADDLMTASARALRDALEAGTGTVAVAPVAD